MAGGLVGTGLTYKKSAMQSMQRYASLDEKLKADAEMANKQLDAAEKQQNASMGAAGGMVVGLAVTGGNPIGGAVGALIGGVAGSMF